MRWWDGSSWTEQVQDLPMGHDGSEVEPFRPDGPFSTSAGVRPSDVLFALATVSFAFWVVSTGGSGAHAFMLLVFPVGR